MQSVIVRYEGALKAAAEVSFPNVTVVELFNQYAIVTLPEEDMEAFFSLPEVEYIERPKRLYFNVEDGRRVSCINTVQGNVSGGQEDAGGLTGEGVLVGIIDSGIDYTHPTFIRDDGTSRIAFLWDQSATGESQMGRIPAGFSLGAEYTQEDFDEALALPEPERSRLVPVRDRFQGHGTAVAGVAAGNGRGSAGRRNRGVAIDSDLIVVKLAQRDDGFPRTTEVMEGLDYVLRKAIALQKPVAINLSFGNNYGPHDGQSLFENYITELNGIWKNMIVIASGNEGDARHHTEVQLQQGVFSGNTNPEVVELAVGNRETGLTVQLWKSYVDSFRLEVQAPNGRRYLLPPEGESSSFSLGTGAARLLLFHGVPSPYTITQEIYMEWLGNTTEEIPAGVWRILLYPDNIRNGICNLWMSGAEASGRETGFLNPVTNTTLTIPATAARTLSVGAYQSNNDTIAPFSGRGFTSNGQIAPTIVAPGVDIVTAAPGGGYTRQTGTSIAAPFVTGSAALLMEWGIVRGNDVELYGEKGKAYLMRGARKLSGISSYPSTVAGWGALCLRDSLPL